MEDCSYNIKIHLEDLLKSSDRNIIDYIYFIEFNKYNIVDLCEYLENNILELAKKFNKNINIFIEILINECNKYEEQRKKYIKHLINITKYPFYRDERKEKLMITTKNIIKKLTDHLDEIKDNDDLVNILFEYQFDLKKKGEI